VPRNDRRGSFLKKTGGERVSLREPERCAAISMVDVLVDRVCQKNEAVRFYRWLIAEFLSFEGKETIILILCNKVNEGTAFYQIL
jgi:hypothetical protein